jgi:hypothetical protein
MIPIIDILGANFRDGDNLPITFDFEININCNRYITINQFQA